MGCKGTVFHLAHSLFVGPVLESLMSLVRGGEALLAVGGSMRVEDSNIKVSPFKRNAPKAIGGNVQPQVVA